MPTQPSLHDLVSCVRAPATALSGRDGQIRARGAEGLYVGDLCVLAAARLVIDDVEPQPLAVTLSGPSGATFVAAARGLADRGVDPAVTVVRARRAEAAGMTETITVSSAAEEPLRVRVAIQLVADASPMDAVKSGAAEREGSAAGPVRVERVPGVPDLEAATDSLCWRAADSRVRAQARGASVDPMKGELGWWLTLDPGERRSVAWEVRVAAPSGATATASEPAPWAIPRVRAADPRLPALVDRAVADLDGLRMTERARSGGQFLAAGSPWFLTLFGRDSLWAARMILPLGTGIAADTLRVLAGYQGSTVDPETGEAPGKILHEVRRRAVRPAADSLASLPPVYFGTVDATLLWVSLLHDAWRWGLPVDQVHDLLPAARRAMGWLREYADPDGDGFVEYLDQTGRLLANQGWKDSGDAVRYRDGTQARAPIALVEVQGYAHRAALDAAELFEAFDLPGGDEWRSYAARLATRFRRSFWVEATDGPYPAMALDRDNRRVDALTSNMGHLLASGLLTGDEAELVARRLCGPAMDSGYGLRTMAESETGYAPLSYHCGSVWPHDTAIVAHGLAATGHPGPAGALLTGLLRASAAFEARLPELYGGFAASAGAPVPYPAACRPQAWSAAAAVSALTTLLGLDPDVPSGVLRVRPLHPAPVPGLAVSGLRLAGEELTVELDADGRPQVHTRAGVEVRCAGY